MSDRETLKSAYGASRPNGNYDCIIGGMFKTISSRSCPKAIKWPDHETGTQICANRGETLCQPVLWCKKDGDKVKPFCVPTDNQQITVACATEAAKDPADCSKLDGFSNYIGDVSSKLESLCQKDERFKAFFCAECRTMAKALVALNQGFGDAGCGQPTPGNGTPPASRLPGPEAFPLNGIPVQ
jgi:hypothetical protein